MGRGRGKNQEGERGGWDTELEIDDEESRKAREKEEQENEGGGREKNGGKKVGDQMRQGWETQIWSERRCYFKTVLTDNVTLLQSAKRSCHAPAWLCLWRISL